MDVTCERCGTEYEFDETLVSERGTTVKCTNCGHLFKVYPPGAGPQAERERGWIVRRGDGREDRLASLRELQQRIAQGELEVDDQLSRGGEQWKRLGDIAELDTFFRAAAAARAPETMGQSTRPSLDSPKRTLFGVGAAPSVPAPPAPPSVPPPSAPPPRRNTPVGYPRVVAPSAPPPGDPAATRAPSRRDHTEPFSTGAPRTVSTAPPSMGPGATSSPPPRRDPTPARPPSAPHPRRDPTPQRPISAPPPRRDPTPQRPISAPPPARPVSGVDATELARPRGATSPLGGVGEGTGAPAPPPARGALRPAKPALYLDEDAERPPLPTKRSSAGMWVVVVLLLAGVGVALGWTRIAPALGLGGGDEALVARLNAGAAEYETHTIESYDAALREYLRASALAEGDPRVLLGLARTEAAWAEALSFEAEDLEARAAQDPALAGRAAAKRDELGRRAIEAKRHAEALLRVQIELSSEVALADALRIAGQGAEARQRLDRASQLLAALPSGQAASPEDASAYHLAVAMLAGGWPAALPAARDAVSANPSSLRARLVLARALLVTRDVAAARRELDEVLRRSPRHPRARALVDAIEQGIPPAAPTVEVEEPTEPVAVDATSAANATSMGAANDSTMEPSTPTMSPRETTPRETAPRATTGGAAPTGRDYSFYVRRGEQLLDSGDFEGANSHFELALQQRPGGAEALTGLGYAALRRGNAAEAARHFRPAARNDYGDAYIGLGDAYRRMGRNDDALQTYRAYLASRPNGPLASIARQQIAALEAQAPAADPSTMEPAPATMEAAPAPAPPTEAPPPADEP